MMNNQWIWSRQALAEQEQLQNLYWLVDVGGIANGYY
jgi:hypothetical protein